VNTQMIFDKAPGVNHVISAKPQYLWNTKDESEIASLRLIYLAGLSIRVVAEILAWSEDQVEKIIRKYVARSAATKAAIQQLNEVRKRT
jgi:hypothetical protein